MIKPYTDINWLALKKIAIIDRNPELERVPKHDEWTIEPVYANAGIDGAVAVCYLRQAVIERLSIAAKQISESGYKLRILDGWRPPAVQRALYHQLFTEYHAALPGADQALLHEKTQYFVSLPSENPEMPSPHLTGGSVDVTLTTLDDEAVDMGSGFDEPSERSYTDAYEHSSGEIRERRRILYSAMITAGFTNLPTEWWHFDYGNQVWAYFSGMSVAQFGLVYPK